ncbi:tyrosine-type recombinase/integrase [Lutibacter citreus]|uniref:tyrosine-type recombinase/integrase n=1 Tax=Lutibacter citreus TaxID=2138210 RepID=UPI000DBE78F5|nr:site-specific integrase [Lutibacter citreus]
MDFNTSIYLDSRRAVKGSTNIFPVKLKVYSKLTKKKKLYSTNVSLTEIQFGNIFNPKKRLNKKDKDIQLYLNEFEERANNVAKDLTPFTFLTFEKKLFRNKTAGISVLFHYKQKIASLRKNNQIGTASNYDLSLKSIGTFVLNKVEFIDLQQKEKEINKAVKNLTFYDINDQWLKDYENFMIVDNLKSTTTVSMYLRCLRTIFNDAISQNDIKQDIYPFGINRGKYQIPVSSKTKKALKNEEISLLFNSKPNTKEQEKAKDFWFLSYALYGMNFKDILLLKKKNIIEESLVYYREKTKTTKKGNLSEISIHLNDYAKSIINKYAKNIESDDNYIFSILLESDDAYEQKRKIKNFVSFVNLHFNKYAKSLGFNFKISTYWARHSFATLSIRNGVSMEFISEALNHSNLSVTKNYFAGFEDDTKKEFSNNLMNF